MDSLYSLAVKIRNPLNRPQRTIEQLYKHVPADMRAAYIQEREEFEISTAAFFQRQYLIEQVDRTLAQPDFYSVLAHYSSTEHWLVRRTGVTNARRKQQFAYWKEHVIRLNRMQAKPPVDELRRDSNPASAEAAANPTPVAAMPQDQLGVRSMPHSITTATKLLPNLFKEDDLRSTISHQSRVSTVISPLGHRLEWPDPPKVMVAGGYFTCPYCKILCPQKYLQRGAWM